MTQVWFEGETDHLDIEVTMQVETLRHNVFDFILAPEAAVLPIAHEHDALCARAYLERIERDDAVTAFAAELSLAVNRDTLRFLDRPNRQLFAEVTQTHRDAGAPQGPVFYPAEPTRGMSRSGRVVRRLLAEPHASRAVTSAATSGASDVICMPGRKYICPAPAGADSIPPMGRQWPTRM